jgi:hypothetical protein
MKFFGKKSENKPEFERANPMSMGDFRFMSTAALERSLDGSEEQFAAYYFAMYHCSPNEPAGINEYREQLRQKFPTKAIQVGKHFVLTGEAAYLALAAYYQALIDCETLKDDFRAYASERFDAITNAHRDSQSLPVPIDLFEGQLSQDFRLEFLTCIAIYNGQVVLRAAE